jgi:hypothetical protein
MDILGREKTLKRLQDGVNLLEDLIENGETNE